MIKLVKDLLFGEPVVAVTLVGFVLAAWVAALTQTDIDVPLWLAIASPASVAIGGFYVRANMTADNAYVAARGQPHTGGPVPADQATVVGEHGPEEVVVPDPEDHPPSD